MIYLKKGEAEDIVHVQWLARGNDTVLGNTSDPREFFLTRECENVNISDVSTGLASMGAPLGTESSKPPSLTQNLLASRDRWWKLIFPIFL